MVFHLIRFAPSFPKCQIYKVIVSCNGIFSRYIEQLLAITMLLIRFPIMRHV